MPSFMISQKSIMEAMQHKAVRDRLEAKANEVAARAKSIAGSEKVDAEFDVKTGTRPKGRPYARVICSNPDQEFGTSKTARHRILGRSR